jgi:hypothetical protein
LRLSLSRKTGGFRTADGFVSAEAIDSRGHESGYLQPWEGSLQLKQSLQAGVQHAERTTAPARSQQSQRKGATGSRLAQLAAFTNNSTRVQALAERRADLQHGRGVQGLKQLASQINQSPPDPSPGHAPTAVAGQDDGAPVQRVRILLKDEDQDLMERVRQVPVANVGGQTLQSTDGIGDLNEIGQNESIVLEGHGYWDDPIVGSRKVVSQGGIPPAELAAIVHRVPKPDNWSGNVVLLGCATGYITAKVSEEYFKLTEKPVKVIGTRASIRVGSKEDGEAFAGYEWSGQPESQRPRDLAYVEDLRIANKAFSGAMKQVIAVAKALSQNLKGPAAIPHPVDKVEVQGQYLIDVDSLSDHRKDALEGRSYAKPERLRLVTLLTNVTQEIHGLSFFEWPSTVRAIGDPPAALEGVKKVNAHLVKLVDEGNPLRELVDHILLGYTLKEVDLSSNVSSLHSKRKRTKKSIFGDTWVDEP